MEPKRITVIFQLLKAFFFLFYVTVSQDSFLSFGWRGCLTKTVFFIISSAFQRYLKGLNVKHVLTFRETGDIIAMLLSCPSYRNNAALV